jgi:hypothetical protein
MYSMMKACFRLLAITFFCLLFQAGHAQSVKKEAKLYKVVTSGRQLSIKSSKPIQTIMVWTTDGNRIVEQKNINNNLFTIDIPVYRKAFYLMIGFTNGKIFTEKIGVL